jgi:methionine-rich copper-binding protein CopC
MKPHLTLRSLIAALMLSTAGIATVAAAHARLVAETPKADAVVTAPKRLVLLFSEAVVPHFTGADVTGPRGERIEGVSQTAKDAKTLTISLPASLEPGRYDVKWHAAAADDGHHTSGDYIFTVR